MRHLTGWAWVTPSKKEQNERPLRYPPTPFKWTHVQCKCCGLWWPLMFVPAVSK